MSDSLKPTNDPMTRWQSFKRAFYLWRFGPYTAHWKRSRGEIHYMDTPEEIRRGQWELSKHGVIETKGSND